MVFQNDILAGASGTAAGYTIDQSIRFDGSAYLSRTPASAGNRKTFTLNVWLKLTEDYSANATIIGSGGSNDSQVLIDNGLTSPNTWRSWSYSGSYNAHKNSTQVARDFSAWYMFTLRVDTTEATAADRWRMYVNGEQITSFTTDLNPSLNLDTSWNQAVATYIGQSGIGGERFEGYMAEFVFIDGQALAPTNFGEYNDDGVWVPIDVSGLTFGSNGYYLDFADSSDLGKDVSGNGNDFTSSGLTSDDQVLDTPTDNYATFSPINLDSVTLSNGNLFCGSAGYWSGAAATIALPNSGKWYIETLVGNRFGSYMGQGFAPANYGPVTEWSEAIYYGAGDSTATPNYGLGMSRGNTFGFYATSGTTTAAVFEPDGSTIYSTNDLYICHALDLDNERYWVGTAFVGDSSVTWYGPSGSGADPTTPSTGLDISAYLATYGDYGLTFFHGPNATSASPSATVDFGQSGYTFTKPSGFNTVSTANLPGPAIADGSAYFQTTLYTGDSSTQEINQSGNSTFQPDLVWVKTRSTTYDHTVFDAVRDVENLIRTNSTAAELSDSNSLTSFDADGYTVGSRASVNQSGETFAAWQWLAGNGTASNTNGSITSTVSANTTAGFSIISYTGNATSGATIGHGLGTTPELVIVKRRDSADTWRVLETMVNGGTHYLRLDTNGASTASSGQWNDTNPDATNVTLGTDTSVNASGGSYVMYVFASVPGFSKFGKYTGNGSTDGTFIWCGFRPAFVMTKRTNSTGNWTMFDNQREGYNVDNDELVANTTAAETTTDYVDILSNGFKLRSSDADVNASGSTYIFMAFAEHPFGGNGVAPVPAR